MEKQSVELWLTKQTKGTYVYATEGEKAVCTQVYLRKDAVGPVAPQRIKLTVETLDGSEVG